MAQTTPTTGPLSRFLRFTTQKEPVVSAGFLAAVVLYVISRFVPLTDDDLQLLGLLLVPIVTALVARFQAWSPASVEKATRKAFDQGVQDAPLIKGNPFRADGR